MAQSVKRVVGLKNLGNTCYLNSVLQSLASSSSLRSFLESSKHHHGKQPLTEALHETLEELNKDYIQMHSIEPPRGLLKVGPISAMLSTKEQQDAHELMQVIMNILDDEHSPHVSSGLKSLSMKQLHNPRSQMKPIFPFQRGFPPLSPTPSHVRKDAHPLPTFVNRTRGEVEFVKLHPHQENPFYGLMATRKRCTSCGRESPPDYQKFYGLSVSIPESTPAETCTLYECMDQFIKPQMVEDVEWPHQDSPHDPPPPLSTSPRPFPHPLVAGDAACEPLSLPSSLGTLPFDSKQDPFFLSTLSTSPPKSKPITFRSQPSHRFPISSSPPRGASPPRSSSPTLSSSPLSTSPLSPPPLSSSPPKNTFLYSSSPTAPMSIPVRATGPPLPIPRPITSKRVPSSPFPPISPRGISPSAPLSVPTPSSSLVPPPRPSTHASETTSHASFSSSSRTTTACASGRCTALLYSTIARPPLSLCLHLRRLVMLGAHPSFVKLDTHIQFPIMLDLASYCGLGIDISSGLSPKPHPLSSKIEYKLVAVIVHSGGACGGHFTVFRRLAPIPPDTHSRWANISDDCLVLVEEQQVLESEAYMLYYEREREGCEAPAIMDNAALLSEVNNHIKSGLCFALQQTIGFTPPPPSTS